MLYYTMFVSCAIAALIHDGTIIEIVLLLGLGCLFAIAGILDNIGKQIERMADKWDNIFIDGVERIDNFDQFPKK